ncbi:vasoactive intestinal polypeptide receptor-like [Protopterus annectens]|uniref:vasoactive intestinal polypeptide receptor-like n=1 Tax=Protopterus annectens TaxID=7888 RepID=UPI001CFB0D0B|nr:vasoactive intestinal polypeptide receptor-like [Protopterus annectens]
MYLKLHTVVLNMIFFTCFRKFHCTRNYIHMHLFGSFILRASTVITKDVILFSDPVVDHCTLSTVPCKIAVVFFHFGVLSNFFWLFIEGMYLQTLLALTFVSGKKYFWWFIVIGWGGPTAVMIIWIVITLLTNNTGCWDNNKNVAVWWIIKGPILLTISANFVIFVNVIRILVQKLRSSNIGGAHSSHFIRLAKSTLLLIPLFGVHYVVFAFFSESVAVEMRLFVELALGSFQGFVVALLYCFMNGEVQNEIKKYLRRWQCQRYFSLSQKSLNTPLESSATNFVTQSSLLEKLSPKQTSSWYHNSISAV